MPSLSFDPFAHIYDATRGYPPDIAQKIAEAIDSAACANAQTAFLEVGIGTGRIAFPLVSRGRNYTGVDISEKMVEQLEAKLIEASWQAIEDTWGSLPDEDTGLTPVVRRFVQTDVPASMRLVMADMTQLPFQDASFDVVVAVHVFHLVDGWQQAVHEVRRVLRPGGALLHCWDEYGKSDVQSISEAWHNILQELGVEDTRPGTTSQHMVTDLLQEWGLQTEQTRVLTWEQTVTPRLILENIFQRRWSGVWIVPEEIFTVAIHRLQQWANDYYGEGIDTVRHQERHFTISKTRM